MTTFYIYEVPGRKNGATKDWKKRSKYNINEHQIKPIIVETMEGPDTEEFWQVVGDREWELADLNGYDRGTHYRVIRVRASKYNFDDAARAKAKANGSQIKAGKAGGAKTMELAKIPGTPSYIREQRRKRNGGAVAGKIEYTCPLCGKVGRGGRMKGHINSKLCQK